MPPTEFRFDAIGTHWQIDSDAALTPAVVRSLLARAEQYDHTWSRFREDSLVHRIATEAGRFELPVEASALLALYRSLYECTDGAVSPLVGRALEQWGYDRAYTLRASGIVAPVPAWDEAMAWDGTALETVRPVVLDVGAAGKGYLVDLLAEILVEFGIDEFTIDASGDLLHRGGTPLRVALEHPLDPALAVGVANFSGGALCASASNRRAWPGAHHMIDAVSGLPTGRVLATWVTAATGLVADGLATALFFTDPDRLAERFDFECVRMLASGALERSTGFDGELFL